MTDLFEFGGELVLISIRGTNGSGKSSVVLTLMAAALTKKPLFGLLGANQPEAYELRFKGVARPVYILGPYITPIGGCDRIQPYDLILDLLRKYVPKGHVLFEGVLVATNYGRVGRFMEEFGHDSVMAFMDTSLDTCIANVNKRRTARSDGRVFDPKKLTDKFNRLLKAREKIKAEGKPRVVDLNYGNATEQVLELLRSVS